MLVTGQIIVRFFIEPIHELRKMIGEVGEALIYHSHIYLGGRGVSVVNRGESKTQVTSEALRKIATLLFVKAEAIPWYGVFHSWGLIPGKVEITIACDELLAVSLFIDRGGTPPYEPIKKIVNALGLPQRIVVTIMEASK